MSKFIQVQKIFFAKNTLEIEKREFVYVNTDNILYVEPFYEDTVNMCQIFFNIATMTNDGKNHIEVLGQYEALKERIKEAQK